VIVPLTWAYRGIYYLLCFLHMCVFVVLKDLVIFVEMAYEYLTSSEEAENRPAGEAVLPKLEPPDGLPPRPEPARPSETLPKSEPVVEMDRPAAPAPSPASAPARADVPGAPALPDASGFMLRVRASEPAAAAEPPAAQATAPAPVPAPPAPVAAEAPSRPAPVAPAAKPIPVPVAKPSPVPSQLPSRPAPAAPAPKPSSPEPRAVGQTPPAPVSAAKSLELPSADEALSALLGQPSRRELPLEEVGRVVKEHLEAEAADDEHEPISGDDALDSDELAEETARAEEVRRLLRDEKPLRTAAVPGPVKPAPVPAAAVLPPATPASEPAVAADVTVKTFPTGPGAAAPEARPGLLGAAVRTAAATALKIAAVVSKEYRKPTEDLFLDPPVVADREDEAALRTNAEKLVEALAQFRIQATITRITQGPTVTQYEVKPAPGIKISNIVNLSNDIAMAMATAAIRIEAPIPGRSAVGIEIPNRRPIPVTFKEIITHDVFRKNEAPLTCAIGKEITGKPIVADLARMPHLLVAGATGSGKSVCINTIISSLLYRSTPDEVKFILIDPKVVELALYDGIPNLITEVITDPQDATAALRWAVLEMERRYRYLSKFAARDIRSFNRRLQAGDLKPLDDVTPVPDRPMPYIVVVIDELADLMMLARKEIEDAITRLAQMARAIGIHLVLATQRPSTNIITGVLKANLPSRIAFSVSSQVDSKVILDCSGAEKLLGSGDMLYSPIGQAKPFRLQGAYISEDEVRNLVAHLKTCGDPDYSNIVEEVMEPDNDLVGDGLADDKFGDCVRIALENQEASTSMLQRHLKIGYNRAARIIEAMEARGIISGPESGKRRKLLITASEAERYLGPEA
jgi:DNA segregation ATPase FtsK/SpoIIIE-like protein